MKNIVLTVGVLLTLFGSGNSMGAIVQQFFTEESHFVKMQNESAAFDYYHWDQQCRELGDGYTPAVFYSQGEYKFIRVFVSKKWVSRAFWIGGSTNGGGPKGSIELFEYLPTSAGERRVRVDTAWGTGSHPSVMYTLKNAEPSSRLKSVLCRSDGVSFQLDNAIYQKLVSSTPRSRDYWLNRCSTIGRGWIPVIINSETELQFILENQMRLSNNQSFWIAGSTRTTGDIDFLHYFQYELGGGSYPVYVSSESGTFQLTSGSNDLLLHGILCENDGLVYETETSFYRRRSGAKFPYRTWEERCFDLGAGWGPAIVNDTAELNFIKSQERLSPDNRNYWLGGLAYQTVGVNQVWLLSKWAGGSWTTNPSHLVLRKRWNTAYGILCEKAKN